MHVSALTLPPPAKGLVPRLEILRVFNGYQGWTDAASAGDLEEVY